ncbi:uncharacterized protein V1510DRAFT_411694 [Dipodascopsis tothii]|uniref:uncharacterized protein n=1 Tax=Dipodascopsis tothii TaxID=44089 RepID=UPI0034CDD615
MVAQIRDCLARMEPAPAAASTAAPAQTVVPPEEPSVAVPDAPDWDALPAAELRTRLKDWGLKPARSKKDMAAQIRAHLAGNGSASPPASQAVPVSQVSAEEVRSSAFSGITAHVRGATGRDWWERILTYEPLVIEDFVDHLVDAGVFTGVLAADKRTKPALYGQLVRDWCDSKSVCWTSKLTRQN